MPHKNNNVNIVFLGDIVGSPGRNLLIEKIPFIKTQYKTDFIIINGENAAGGKGISYKIANNLLSLGIDAITLGDHVWDQKDMNLNINKITKLCRPANLPEECPGASYVMLHIDNFVIAVFTLLGRTFMKIKSECPFKKADLLINKLKNKVDAFIVEIHAEATSEKVALGRYLEGRVAMVVGTHTHIPTADAILLKGQTGYITDLGMCGPYDSILGVKKDIIINCFLDGMPRRFEIAENNVRLYGCFASIQRSNGLCSEFKSIYFD